jgi:hypothetical protein
LENQLSLARFTVVHGRLTGQIARPADSYLGNYEREVSFRGAEFSANFFCQ